MKNTKTACGLVGFMTIIMVQSLPAQATDEAMVVPKGRQGLEMNNYSNAILTIGKTVGAGSNVVVQIDFNERLTAAYYADGPGTHNTGDRILAMIGRDVSIVKADRLSVSAKGDGREHWLGMVLTDNGGESHFLGKRIINGTTWQAMEIDLAFFLKSPSVGEITGKSWGGDGNQKIDFPIKRIELGFFDEVRGFEENSGVEIGQVKFYIIP